MRAVIIFVVLAIGTGLSPFRSSRICPVSLSSKIASLAVIAGGFPLAVRIGVGFCVGVGVMDVNGGVIAALPWLDVSNKRFPTGVRVRIGTTIMVLIDMNSKAIATVRRIIHPPGTALPLILF